MCHVLNCADVLTLTAITSAVGDDVYVLDRAVRHLQPDLELHIAAVSARSLDAFLERRQIFGVDSSTDDLKGRWRS